MYSRVLCQYVVINIFSQSVACLFHPHSGTFQREQAFNFDEV